MNDEGCCSFCLRNEGEGGVESLRRHAGPPSVAICNKCLDLCTDIFSEEDRTDRPDLSGYVCSFCDMNQRRRLVAGPRVYICDECVDRFNAT